VHRACLLWFWVGKPAHGWQLSWASRPVVIRCCVSCVEALDRSRHHLRACSVLTTGPGARDVGTAQFSVIWNVARSLICCRTVSAERTEQWLRAHPGSEIISRDRASLYAEAATRAARHAVQMADRLHLLHNMSEALVRALVPHHRLLAELAQAPARRPQAATAPEVQQPPSTQPPSRKHRVQEQNRERRLARYEVVMEQLRQGISERQIARNCGLSRQTVHLWISARSFPERRPSSHSNTVDPPQKYLEQRWRQGCRNAAQLWRELRERGFAGQRIVRDWIRKHCGSRSPTAQRSSAAKPPRSSPRQVAWLLLKQPEEARSYLEELNRRSPGIATCASLAREFCRTLRQRDAAAWVAWREAAITSPLARFATHLCRDEAAVLADLQYRWSNGPVEGHVHRLKLIKRSMYGRANFDLLRLRVVNADYMRPPQAQRTPAHPSPNVRMNRKSRPLGGHRRNFVS
jgi:transposase